MKTLINGGITFNYTTEVQIYDRLGEYYFMDNNYLMIGDIVCDDELNEYKVINEDIKPYIPSEYTYMSNFPVHFTYKFDKEIPGGIIGKYLYKKVNILDQISEVYRVYNENMFKLEVLIQKELNKK